MLNRLSVSTLLRTVILVTVMFVIAGFAWNAWSSWQQLQTANRIALIAGVPDPAARRQWTYAELHSEAQRTARALLRRFDEPDPTDRLDVRSPVAGRVLRLVRESASPVVRPPKT